MMAVVISDDILAWENSLPNDSIANALKLNSLKKQKERIQKEIKLQDAKRNKMIPGVSYETMEQINDSQDSVCLDLRSKLVDVMLEIKDLNSVVISPGLINQFNNLMNSNTPEKTKK